MRWPGLPDDPSHPVAARQMTRFGGVLAFELPSAAAVGRFVTASALVASATSFGGLLTTADRRERWGDPVGPGFVRLSCGCEDTAELVTDVLGNGAGLLTIGVRSKACCVSVRRAKRA